ncbi:hypothetical protein BDY24DRAFT_33863 [Mrakia frigida]|uniref:uncharacterized protein n=1 Tax=Mrakia frigida TaxID=29902 RepID=UPI003FCBF1ED
MSSSPHHAPALVRIQAPPPPSSQQDAPSSITHIPMNTPMAKRVAPLPPQTEGFLSPKLACLRTAPARDGSVVYNPYQVSSTPPLSPSVLPSLLISDRLPSALQDFPRFLQGLASLHTGTPGPFDLQPHHRRSLVDWYHGNMDILRKANVCRRDSSGRVSINEKIWDRLHPQQQPFVIYLGELLRHEAVVAVRQANASIVAASSRLQHVAVPTTPRIGQQQVFAHSRLPVQAQVQAQASAQGLIPASGGGPSAASSPVVDSKVEVALAATPCQVGASSSNPLFNTPPTGAATLSKAWTHATVLLYSLTTPSKAQQGYAPNLPAQRNRGVYSTPDSNAHLTRRSSPYTYRATPYMFMGYVRNYPSYH